jgi:hypothetical protein
MESLNEILTGSREGPCLSLYQPTHRSHPQKQQDLIRFRNLVKLLEESLGTKYPDRDAAARRSTRWPPMSAFGTTRSMPSPCSVRLACSGSTAYSGP